MPDYFSHGIVAEIIYEKLNSEYKSKISSMQAYLLGAQGGDVFFAYNIKPTKANLGRSLHRKNAVYLFNQLIQGNLSYAAGFATHYALDFTLHPFVYDYERGKRSPLAHTKFENDLGLFISRKYGVRRKIMPLEQVLSCTGCIYDSIKRVEPLITITGVEKCLNRHFAYTRFMYLKKKQEYKCAYDFENLSDEVERGVKLGIKAVKCVLDKDVDPEVFGGQFLQKSQIILS